MRAEAGTRSSRPTASSSAALLPLPPPRGGCGGDRERPLWRIHIWMRQRVAGRGRATRLPSRALGTLGTKMVIPAEMTWALPRALLG